MIIGVDISGKFVWNLHFQQTFHTYLSIKKWNSSLTLVTRNVGGVPEQPSLWI